MKNEKIYDVLIVGAGPSGSNTAISYKNMNPNLKIGIIDKAMFPRDKSCGDAIGPGVINALKRFNNEHILENEPQVISTSLFGPDNIGIQNYIPKVKNKDDSVVYVIPRYELDNRIFNIAKDLNVESYENTRFIKYENTEDENILRVEIQDSENQKKFMFTRLLVGADGANSRVRKNLDLKQNTDIHKACLLYTSPSPRD